jgi:HSP20 family molecular chaperone IbpA
VLPGDSDVTAMTATWADDVLEVVIPREQREATEVMKIEIQ